MSRPTVQKPKTLEALMASGTCLVISPVRFRGKRQIKSLEPQASRK